MDSRQYDGSYVPDQPDFTPEQWEWVKARIDKVIDDRTTSAHPMAYFAPPDDSLVTYRALAPVMVEMQQLHIDIWALRQQMRPWWKRWFGR